MKATLNVKILIVFFHILTEIMETAENLFNRRNLSKDYMKASDFSFSYVRGKFR